MKRLTAILLLAAFFCGCARTDGAMAEMTAAETSALPETTLSTEPASDTKKLIPLPTETTGVVIEKGTPYKNNSFKQRGIAFINGTDIVDLPSEFDRLVVLWNESTQTGDVMVFHQQEDTHIDVSLYSITDIDWVWEGSAAKETFTLIDESICIYNIRQDGTMKYHNKGWMLWKASIGAWHSLQIEVPSVGRYGASYQLYAKDECANDNEWVFFGQLEVGVLYLVGGGASRFDEGGTKTIAKAKQIYEEAFSPDAPRTAEEALKKAPQTP